MGAINVQSQMLAAPTAVMAEQAVIGLVEHPEQPMTIDIANPGCRHKLWVPWQTSDVKVNGHLVRRASQPLPDIQTLPAAVDNLSAQSLRYGPCLAWHLSPGAAFALFGDHMRHDLNDLTDERIKPLRVGASVGAECLRLPSIDRYQATAKVHDFVLRHHGTKGIDTQRNPSPLITEKQAPFKERNAFLGR